MLREESAKKYCCEDISKIENYEKAVADTTQTWDCHHRMELVATGDVVDSTAQDLKDWGIYYNRPADELIFLTHIEHCKLHNRNRSEETRKKISKAHKGRPGYFKGHCHSEEARKKLSIANTGKTLSEETRKKVSEAKKGNTNTKGKKWFNNGIKSVMAFECPEGFKPGRIYRRK